MAGGLHIKIRGRQVDALRSLQGKLILAGDDIVYIKYAYMKVGTEKYGFRKRKERKYTYVYAAELHTWSADLDGYYTMTDTYVEKILLGYSLYTAREKYLKMENQFLKMRDRYGEKTESSEKKSTSKGNRKRTVSEG
jgi:hypothetical protein